MSQLRIEKSQKFKRELDRLGKRHSGLVEKVDNTLNSLAIGERPDGKRLFGYNELLIFQIRCGTGNMGRRGGARIIYYKDKS